MRCIISARWKTAAICSLVTIAVFADLAVAHAQSARSVERSTLRPPSTMDEAFARGDYARARTLAMNHDDTPSLLGRSRLALMDGDLEAAARFSGAALSRATNARERHEGGLALAKIDYALGRWDEAEARLRAILIEEPHAFGVRLALGECLIGRGATQEATEILDAFSSYHNNGLLQTPSELTFLGQAMQLLGSFNDANYAFEQALRRDPEHLGARIAHGELLLSKYNIADAERAFERVLTVNPNHPGALVGMARIELSTTNHFEGVYTNLEKATAVAPGDPDVRLVWAELAIYNSDCEEARAQAGQVLATRPRHLEALTIMAACHYLDDNLEAYEEVRDKALSFRADYAEVLTETARYAVQVHRYEEAVGLNRQALEVRSGFAPALLGLGVGLSRTGHEDEALDVLKEAFEADPYNVRVYNMLEFYEKTMPDYVFTDLSGFKLRAHKDQYELLEKVVAPIVQDALEEFRRKYDFEIDPDLAVEIYADAQTFGVRSVGLPHVSPHGICFGKVVVSRSPAEGNFNWEQVIWHELAHVFHIQMANSRVPRWFTEGLAEYETNIKDPAWIRHHDPELARALFAGQIPSVMKFDQGFTHARTMQDVVIAYQLSSLAIHYIVQTYGFDAIVAMLRGFGERKQMNVVFGEVLKQDAEQFDRGFEMWLRARLMGFEHQLDLDLASLAELEVLEEQARGSEDGEAWAMLALGRLRGGDASGSKQALDKALELAPTTAMVRYIAALIAMHQDRVRDAYDHGLAALDAHRDGHALRVLLGRAALALEDMVAARVHLEAAALLYPDSYEVWDLLAGLRGDAALTARAQRRLFELDQNDAGHARRRAQRAAEAEQWALALEAARRWVGIRPFDLDSHLAVATASLRLSEVERAEKAWEVALVLRRAQRGEVLLGIVAELTRAGWSDKARDYATLAASEGVAPAMIERALNPE